MNLRQTNSKIRIAFVGADDDATGFRDGEVDASQSRIGLTEPFSQVMSSRLSQIVRIRSAFFCSKVFMKTFADFFFANVNRGQNNMAGSLFAKLHDAFAKVSVNNVNAVFFQKRIEMTLFGQHRLAFDQSLHLMAFQNAEHNFVVLMSIRRPVDDDSILRGVGFELLKILGHPRLSMSLNGRRGFAEQLPLRNAGRHAVAFFTHEPQRLIVPLRTFAVVDESLS